MTNEQTAQMLEILERIADSLEALSELAMSRNTFHGMKPGHEPHIIDCLALIADSLDKRS
jgi:hypothetical protein